MEASSQCRLYLIGIGKRFELVIAAAQEDHPAFNRLEGEISDLQDAVETNLCALLSKQRLEEVVSQTDLSDPLFLREGGTRGARYESQGATGMTRCAFV